MAIQQPIKNVCHKCLATLLIFKEEGEAMEARI
jgi:hypothetical protein